VLMQGWWLASQPRAVRIYVPVAVALSVLVTAGLSLRSQWDVMVVVHGVAWAALAISSTLVLRRRVLSVPVEQAAQNLCGVWGLSALLIWGWSEALIVSLLVAGLWEEVARRRWERQSKPYAQVALDCGADLLALFVAAVVLGSGQAGWAVQVAAVGSYLVVNCVVVLSAVCMALGISPARFLVSWTTLVMVLTEATVSIGMAAAWRTSHLAAVGLAWSVVAANAGMHYMRLHELASTDARTGLMTAQAWQGAAGRVLTRSDLAILMCDLDHFKALNDSQGHLVGDEVLGRVGDIIKQTLRVGDLACRWGGEEFTIALPGMSLVQGAQVAERLRRAVALGASSATTISMSVGVAAVQTMPMDDAPAALEDAVREADRAMYEAKSAGRDRLAVGRVLSRR
jgi:diguanylate cyclase (GGDEF)-like protein